ncbi:MAG: hypothetical protein A2270_07625 [Elusimicrobia bacterium RIFOXYA12_FULL_51_18]|nr:MAG: hypothetical protein A2270_07625 [Elusimicrobia bacterium RIFOXYA12_FULL_51_18]OGS29935.1 MAG: hypothetical protein A2218_12295 [Elusimicrobia bacterium RIFOXYA2_FULL_53_38]
MPINLSNSRIFINAYGVTLRFETADTGLLNEISEDFTYFSVPDSGDPVVTIKAVVAPPDAATWKGARKLFKSSKWTVFETHCGTRVVLYPEGLMCEYDYSAEIGKLSSENTALLREISYLLILSRLGEKLDLCGLHRVHALAAAFDGAGILLTAPSGGGKTTLLMALAGDPDFKILADDTPLVDSHGTLFPFPLRAGLSEDSPFIKNFPGNALMIFKRRHYPPKYLVPPDFFISKPAPQIPCKLIFLLKRSAKPPLIESASSLWMILQLFKSLVAGDGIPQIAEYFIRPEPSDLLRKARIFAGRSLAALALIKNCAGFHFRLSPDPAANARALKKFLLDESHRHSVKGVRRA